MFNTKQLIRGISGRMVQIEQQTKGCFPLFAKTGQSNWQYSQGGSWVGGFWVGNWALEYLFTQNMTSAKQALYWNRRLKEKLTLNSVHSSMIFAFGSLCPIYWCGAHLADEGYSLCKQATANLAAQFNSDLQCIPLGTALGGGERGRQIFSVDSLAAVVLLLGHADSKYVRLAHQHLSVFLEYGFKKGAGHSSMLYTSKGWSTSSKPGDWSRGQAWINLGLVLAANKWGGRYTNAAQEALNYWLASRGKGLTPDRLSDSGSPTDASATLICSVAMLLFSNDSPKWRSTGIALFSAVTSSNYSQLTPSESLCFNGCYTFTSAGKLSQTETAWGYFFLLLAIALIEKRITTL